MGLVVNGSLSWLASWGVGGLPLQQSRGLGLRGLELRAVGSGISSAFAQGCILLPRLSACLTMVGLGSPGPGPQKHAKEKTKATNNGLKKPLFYILFGSRLGRALLLPD